MAPLAHSVLVTGSNRGIGLEMVHQLVEMTDPPEHIFATCRNPAGSQGKALRDLADKHSRIHIIQLEVENQSSVKASVAVVESHLNGKGLNLLINNAGVNSYASLETVQPEEMLSVFNTNVVGPILVVQEFLPLLKKAAKETATEEMSCRKAAVINITSKLGSIERGFEVMVASMLPYRASKVALNMVTVCMAMELKGDGILCATIHPGWVKTDMGTEKAPLDVESSVQGILRVLANLSSSETGAFLDWEGNSLPW
ncbi:C-factor-like [Eublepharis macularius]|uniref:C-factor-like n=1 Tax=Eublepharis macularius TaxID=481883 RepID=A0AA97LHL6_EUBMA|nr:C-factor-like [Eublepharis macularius]